jgi:hypothetical protein
MHLRNAIAVYEFDRAIFSALARKKEDLMHGGTIHFARVAYHRSFIQ